jgi:hypothetical protein
MTIHTIKRRTAETSPYFFSPKTLDFFGQTMDSFDVEKVSVNGTTYFKITADIRDFRRVCMGQTVRYFDPQTNELLTQTEVDNE